ncbi:SpoIIE family protein phosphatase [candidate division CSSED10-310 bacterium]|uniref:SpoIIE family protein phosphatase n=1 Tax=candidate division CSSED10-310 bacterium TaxID=2855610 RepID=A0ABV6Z1B2_UNCC1
MKNDGNKDIIKILRHARNQLETTFPLVASSDAMNLLQDQIDQQISQLLDRISNLESLINASHILNSTLNLSELLGLFMNLATKELKADRSTLYLIDKKKNELWSLITQGPDMFEIRLPVGKGIAGKVAATGDIININDPYNDPRFNKEIDRKTGYITRNMLCMPMRNKEGEIIGVMQILNKMEGNFTTEDEYYMENLSVQASIAIENAQLHAEALERRRLEAELRVAFQIQKNLQPSEDPQLDGFSITGMNVPCLEIGGDYYDFIELDHALGIAIGDVSGKGIPASLIMANLQAALRVLAPTSRSADEIVTNINILLNKSSTANKFVTFFYGILDFTNRMFTYTNAGHNPPILIRQGEKEHYLTTNNLIMGAFNDEIYTEADFQLKKDDIIVFYTDGITEAMNSQRQSFGEERLIELLMENGQRSVIDMKQIIIDDVTAFSKGQPVHDDITLIILKVH